jgi:hypothetical protein
MQHVLLIVGLIMLLALPPLVAEPGGYGYGGTADKSKDMAKAKVTITAPADGAVLAADQPVEVAYKAKKGDKGDHLHLYLDEGRPAVLRSLSGSHSLGTLSPGKHKIDLQIADKAHNHIGVGQVITVEVR